MHKRLRQSEQRSKVSIAFVEEVEALCSVANTSCVESAVICNMHTDNTENVRTRRAIHRFCRCSKQLDGVESVMVQIEEIRPLQTHLTYTLWMPMAQEHAYLLKVGSERNSCLIVQYLAKAVYQAVIIIGGGVAKHEVLAIHFIRCHSVHSSVTFLKANHSLHVW